MGDSVFELLKGFFREHGYLTIFCALLLENAGVPVPGETILLFASFLAYEHHGLELPWVIVIGIVACTLGDNIGYWIGRRGGRPLLERYQHIFRIKDATIRRGERLFDRFGSHTIFIARFVFGMRIIAGPLAGVLKMEWKRFALFNFLGAATWVIVISLVGYKFGQHWEHLLHLVGRANLIIFFVVAAVAMFVYRRYRAEKHDEESE